MGPEILIFRGRQVGRIHRCELEDEILLWAPSPDSPAKNLKQRWRSGEVLRRAVRAECEADWRRGNMTTGLG